MFPVFPSSFFSMSSDSNGGQDKNFREKDKKNSASVKLKIENFLPNNVTTAGCSENAQRQVLKSEGVFAIEFLDQNEVSAEAATTELLSCVPTTKIFIKKSSEGVLKSTTKHSAHWLRNVKLSPDIHSHNGLLELTPAKNLRIRISKKILPGQEIIMWFSEEVAALMSIPFLTPANIRGNNCYTCHVCHLSFETPNPLKIHLAIACGQQSIDILWIRLHCSLHRTSPTHLGINQETPFRQLGHNQRYSAFKPITPGFYNPGISILPQTSSATDINAAAQIETIVSNMGASKQGHLCIYCGKIYSRKYGLKIHIRTHTGFKPLKCKFCLRPFGDPSNLNKHVRLHMQAGGSTFKCHLCDKILARRRDLQRHMQARHSSNSTELKEKSSSSEDD